MFKVNLLPASYKKRLADKRKTEIILSVAVVFLLGMLIIYGGFAVRLFMLQGQLKNINKSNAVISNEIEELQQYKVIYDGLVSAQKKVDSVMPKSPSAVKFLSLVQGNRPEYVNINSISIQDWQKDAICVIDGDLIIAQNLREALSELNEYADSFKTNPVYGNVVKEVKIVNDMPIVTKTDDGAERYSFRIYVSLSGVINLTDSGDLVTTSTTAPPSTTATTAPATTEGKTTQADSKDKDSNKDKDNDKDKSETTTADSAQ